MWEALKKKSLSYDESFNSLSRRHNVSALNAEAEDAMPLLWGNVFEDSILSFKEFKLGKNDLVLSKNVFNLGLKSSFSTPSKKNSYSKSVDSSNVIFVFVKDSFRVKLIDGLIGIWLSIFPQYFLDYFWIPFQCFSIGNSYFLVIKSKLLRPPKNGLKNWF